MQRGTDTAREYMVPPRARALSAEEIRDVNTRYHDVAADHYDAKWGIDFGELGHDQVLAKVRKALARQARPLRPIAGDRLRDRLLHAEHDARRPDRGGHLHRHLAGHARDARSQRRAAGPEVQTVPADAEASRSRTRASTSCSATRSCTTSPTCRRPSASSSACSRPAARCCSPASPPATATASRTCPSAPRARLRRCGAARSAPAPRRRPTAASPRRRWRASSTSTPSPRPTGGLRQGRRLRRRARHRRGAAGQLVRLDQPHARGHRRPARRALGLAPIRLPRLPALAGARPPPARAPSARGDLLQPDDRRAQAGGITAHVKPARRRPRAGGRRRPDRAVAADHRLDAAEEQVEVSELDDRAREALEVDPRLGVKRARPRQLRQNMRQRPLTGAQAWHRLWHTLVLGGQRSVLRDGRGLFQR